MSIDSQQASFFVQVFCNKQLTVVGCPLGLRTLSSDATTATTVTTKPKVCIIGAGPSGLSLADSLLEKGYTSIVFEKESVPGGKCQAYVDSKGNRYSMGAIQGTYLSYPLAIKYLNKYNVPRQPFNCDAYLYELSTGASITATSYAAKLNATKVATAAQTYMTLSNTYSNYLKPGFPNGIPPALSMTLEDFIEQINLFPIVSIFYRVLTLYGYGSPANVPAVYALVLITDKVFGGSSGLRFFELIESTIASSQDLATKYF